MKKRILSCVLSAALLLGLTPWSALATDDPLDDQTSQTELQTNFQSPPQNPDIYSDPQPNIPVPETPEVQTVPVPAALTAGSVTTEEALRTAVTNGGEVTLGDKITLTSTLTIPTGKSVTLDLNGYTLEANVNADAITIEGTLTLKDSSTGGTITHGMNGSSKYTGRGVKVDGGTFNMYGGSIAGNQFNGTGDGRGCGVFVERGNFNMEGGSIQNNNSTYMNESGSSYGGGVYVASKATFHMSDGTISNNAVSFYGGGVYVTGTFTMSGGSITGNQAGGKGGGVGIESNATFTMTGGSITSNTATSLGNGVYVNDSSCRFTVSGTPNITGNNGSNVYLYTDQKAKLTIGEDGLKSGAKIGVSIPIVSTPVTIATGVDNGYVTGSVFADDSNNYKVRKSGTELVLLGKNGHVDHDDLTFEKALTSGTDGKLMIDNTSATSTSDGYHLSAGSYYLKSDLTLGRPISIASDVKLCLNGHKITVDKNAPVINLETDAKLSLYDCGGTGIITHSSGKYGYGVYAFSKGSGMTFDMYGGTISGNNGNSTYKGGGVYLNHSDAVFNLHDGTISGNTTSASGGGVSVVYGIFNMYNGTISKNTATGSGGGVFLDYGTFNMSGGTIDGNMTTENNGGGVFVNGYGTFNLQNGTISNNKSTASKNISYQYGGGGVYSNGHLYLSGGTITGNTATADGNGVFVRSGSVTLSKDVQIKDNIKDNAQSNLYLNNGAAFKIGTAGLGDKASIGVKVDTLDTGDIVKIATGAGDVDVTGKITSDDSYTVKTINGEVYLANGEVHMHPICGDSSCGDHGNSIKWKPIGTADELNAITSAGNYYLTADIKLTTAWQPKGGVNLCLNGHSVTRTSSDDSFISSDIPIYHGTIYVNQDVTFKLCDCNGSGNNNGIITHSLNPKATSIPYVGSGVYLNGGTLELYGGKITGNYTGASSSNGGGVTVSNNGTLKQYGGEITNNKSSTGGGGVRIHGGTAYLYGGKISNNQARYGGGVCIYSNGKFYAYGGEIKNNTLIDKNNNADCGGGVYLYRSGTSGTNKNELHIKGNVQIINNKAMDGSDNNVYLESYYSGTWGNYVDLSDSMIADGALDPATKIGVTLQHELSYYTDSKAAIVTNLDAANQENYSSIFSYDVSDKEHTLALDGTTLYLKGHQHGDLTYDSNDNTITVKCGSTLGTCGLADRIAGTYTITAPAEADLIYNGYAKAATVTATPKSGVTLPTAPDIQYQTEKGDTLESAPTDAGTYIASITVGGVKAQVKYIVQPKMIDSFTHRSDPLTYNGTEQTCPELNVKDGSVTLKAGTDYTISGTTTGTNAGTYPLQITFCGNYKRDDSKPVDIRWRIDPLTVELFWQNVTDRTYNDGKIVTATVGNKCRADDDVSVTVIGGDGNEYNVTYHATATELTGKDAGNYTLIGCKTEDLNQSYTIGKKSVEKPAANADQFVYNGVEQTYTLAASDDYTLTNNVQKNAGTYTVTVALKDKIRTQWADGKTDDLTYSFTIAPKPVTVTAKDQVTRIGQPLAELTYTCDPAPCAGDPFTGKLTTDADKDKLGSRTITQGTLSLGNNYSITFESGTYTVTKKQIQSNFQFASGPIRKTYGNESFTMTATGAAEGNTVSYESSDTNVATVDNTGKVTIVGAGEATITATAAETEDYGSANKSYTLTVAQAKLTITAKDQSTYIGDKVPELGADSYTVTGLVKGESLTTALTTLPTVRYVDENGQQIEPDMTKAGETVIRASGAEASGNYVIFAFTDGKLTVSARPSSGGGGGSSTPSYPVSTPSKGGNGSVSSNAKNAASGSTVTITVKPDSGYQLETLAVTDHRGNALKLTDQGNGTYTFTMPSGQVDVKATFTQAADETSPFDDVSKDDYYYDAVKWAADSGITGGVGGSLFGSDQSCTRAQIITFLWRAAGSPEPKGAADMTDVPQDAYYAKAVAWAMENGITSGTGADRFSPHAACTRAQGMTFLFRSSKASASGTPAFHDVAADAYYAQAVKWAADNGITSGIGGGLFDPDNGCTRAQIVTFLWKLYAGK